MSEKLSLVRLAYKQPGDDVSCPAIEQELFMITRGAVGCVAAGSSVKAQQNQAWINLGRPKWWRFKSAWYRDGSGSWSAQAVADFQQRYRRYLGVEAKRLAHERQVSIAQQRSEPETVMLGRAEYQTLLSRISALEAALR